MDRAPGICGGLTVALALSCSAALAAADGPLYSIPWAHVAPAIDGATEPVWSEATTASFGIDIYNVTFRALHDGRTLYLLFEDLTNDALEGHDEFWVYFDEEGGAPPRRWDGLWGADPCDADYPEETEEGAWGWLYDAGYAIDERWRQISQAGGVCADLPHLGFTRAVVSVPLANEKVTAEVAIPIEEDGTLDVGPGDELGIYVEIYDDVYLVGRWPEESGYLSPQSFGRAQLADFGCNLPGGAGFDAGFPLDWEVVGSGAAIWRLSGTGGGECGVANQTGASGDSACVAYDGALDGAASALVSPWFPLAGASSVSLAYRGVYAEAPSNPSSALVLEVTSDGTLWTPLVNWTGNHGTSGGEAVTVDLSSLAGQPRIRLRWRFTAASGIAAGAQIDAVRLTCGPFLFSDGFETGLTTHWSAESP